MGARSKHSIAASKANKKRREAALARQQYNLANSISAFVSRFSILATIFTPIETTANDLLEILSERKSLVVEQNVQPTTAPSPPQEINYVLEDEEKLLLRTPHHVVENKFDVTRLHERCEKDPIAIIRGLPEALGMDLSLFTTDSLLKIAKDDEIDTRKQFKMNPDENLNEVGLETWHFHSQQKSTTIEKYAKYQKKVEKAESEEKKEKKIKKINKDSNTRELIEFGTNIDLSDNVKWIHQLRELSKLPGFLRLSSGGNMLSQLDHQILGMNAAQLYMKVPGARTPAHQENNCLASVNVNIGPGDCEWFATPNEYWGVMDSICESKGFNYLKDSYWPNLEDLLRRRVPVYRFTQKAGEVVYIGPGCVHWVQATGVCNNVAWNVGPLNSGQLEMAMKRYEWNYHKEFKSLVPLQHLAWQLAKNVRLTNEPLYTLVRQILVRSLSFSKMVEVFYTSNGHLITSKPRKAGKPVEYCTKCAVEVFNLLFLEKGKKGEEEEEEELENNVYCAHCAYKKGITKFNIIRQFEEEELVEIYNGMTLAVRA